MGSDGGTTNRICVEPTAYKPHAAPLIATETPLSSIGKGGVRFDSDALALLTVALAGVGLTTQLRHAYFAGR